MSYLKIPKELRKKYANNIPGKLEFVSHLLTTTLEKTNIELDQANLRNFLFYRDNKERYPDEFNHAFAIFEANLRYFQEKISSELLNGVVFGGD